MRLIKRRKYMVLVTLSAEVLFLHHFKTTKGLLKGENIER